MNSKQEELVAGHLAGENVADDLLGEIKDDKALLEDLAEFEGVERLLKLSQSDLFVDEVTERLKLDAKEDFVENVVKEIQPKKTIPFVWIAAAACLLLIPFILMKLNSQQPFASLGNSIGAKWSQSSAISDRDVKNGELNLTDGFAELKIANGVELLLEAPAKLNLKSAAEVIVNEGRVVAKIPSGVSSFSLKTPEIHIQEQAVEYGVSVGKKGSEIHTMKGSVRGNLIKQKQEFSLAQNEAGQFDEFQQMTKIISNPSRFMRALPGKSAENPHYLHWTFNNESQEVECIGPGIMGKRYPGKLAALKDGEGPKFEKGLYGQGIYFNGKDAFIETEFKGIGGNRPRTVAFWVKVPKDFSTRNGYGIVSWGALEEGAAWQISPNPTKQDGLIGRLRAGTHKGMVIGTTDLRDDEWHHVAIVMYGGEDAEVSTHILMYIDGQIEKTSKKSVAKIRTNLTGKKSKSLMIGRNLGFSGGRHPNKFFKGSLDELFIFDAALSDEQIRSLMNTNSLTGKGEL